MPNQEPASAWNFGNSSVRVGTQGLFHPCLKTFVAPFLPTDCPWVSIGCVILSEVPLLKSLFFDKKWVPEKARLIFSSSKYCRDWKRIALHYYRDFDGSVTMSRAVTEQIVTQSRRLVEFSVSKWLKLTPSQLFTPLFDWKKEFCNGKPTRRKKGEPLGCPYLLLWVSKLEVFIQLPPAYHENSWTSMVSYRDYIQ